MYYYLILFLFLTNLESLHTAAPSAAALTSEQLHTLLKAKHDPFDPPPSVVIALATFPGKPNKCKWTPPHDHKIPKERLKKDNIAPLPPCQSAPLSVMPAPLPITHWGLLPSALGALQSAIEKSTPTKRKRDTQEEKKDAKKSKVNLEPARSPFPSPPPSSPKKDTKKESRFIFTCKEKGCNSSRMSLLGLQAHLSAHHQKEKFDTPEICTHCDRKYSYESLRHAADGSQCKEIGALLRAKNERDLKLKKQKKAKAKALEQMKLSAQEPK